jgi:hypothetical protein
MTVYHSTEMAGFHFQIEIQYTLLQRHKLVSGKTNKTPQRRPENTFSCLLYFSWFSHRLQLGSSLRVPHCNQNGSAFNSVFFGFPFRRSRHRDRLPSGFFSHSRQIRRMHTANTSFHKMQTLLQCACYS